MPAIYGTDVHNLWYRCPQFMVQMSTIYGTDVHRKNVTIDCEFRPNQRKAPAFSHKGNSIRNFQSFLPDLRWNSVRNINKQPRREFAGCVKIGRRGGIPFVTEWTTLHLSVGIATRYGLDGPGIESRCGARFPAPVQTGHRAHPASYTMGTGSLSRGKSGRGVALTTQNLAPKLKKE